MGSNESGAVSSSMQNSALKTFDFVGDAGARSATFSSRGAWIEALMNLAFFRTVGAQTVRGATQQQTLELLPTPRERLCGVRRACLLPSAGSTSTTPAPLSHDRSDQLTSTWHMFFPFRPRHSSDLSISRRNPPPSTTLHQLTPAHARHALDTLDTRHFVCRYHQLFTDCYQTLDSFLVLLKTIHMRVMVL